MGRNLNRKSVEGKKDAKTQKQEKNSSTSVSKVKDSKIPGCSKCHAVSSSSCKCNRDENSVEKSCKERPSHEDAIMNHVIGAACLLSKNEDGEEDAGKDEAQVSTFDVYIVNGKGKVNGYELKHIGPIDDSESFDVKDSCIANGSVDAGFLRLDRRNKKIPPQEFYSRKKAQGSLQRPVGRDNLGNKEKYEPIILEISEISSTYDVPPETMSGKGETNKLSCSGCREKISQKSQAGINEQVSGSSACECSSKKTESNSDVAGIMGLCKDAASKPAGLSEISDNLSDITLVNNIVDVELGIPSGTRTPSNTDASISLVELKDFVDQKGSKKTIDSSSAVSLDKIENADIDAVRLIPSEDIEGDFILSETKSTQSQPSKSDTSMASESSDSLAVNVVNLNKLDNLNETKTVNEDLDDKEKEAEAMKNVIKAIQMQISNNGSIIGHKVGINNAYKPTCVNDQQKSFQNTQPKKTSPSITRNESDGAKKNDSAAETASFSSTNTPTFDIENISEELKAALLAAFVPSIDQESNQIEIPGVCIDPSFIEKNITKKLGANGELGEIRLEVINPEALQEEVFPGGAFPAADNGGKDVSSSCCCPQVSKAGSNDAVDHTETGMLNSDSGAGFVEKLAEIAEKINGHSSFNLKDKKDLDAASNLEKSTKEGEENNTPAVDPSTIVFVEAEDLSREQPDSFSSRNTRNNKVGNLVKFFEALEKNKKK